MLNKAKSALYLSLVRPILEYAAAVWVPHHHTDIYQLETVQRRTKWFAMSCYNHQSVTMMLHSLEWPTLIKCRNHSKIIMEYKIVYNILYIQPDIPLTYSDAVSTRGHHLKMQQPATRIYTYLHSFFPQLGPGLLCQHNFEHNRSPKTLSITLA